MTNNRNTRSPDERDVVYFVHLHLDTVVKQDEKHPKEDHWFYRVEGKARPMLVVRVEGSERGQRWFRVVPITSKGFKEDGGVKPNHVPIGKLSGYECNSFAVVGNPQRLPEKMLDCSKGQCRIVDTIDPLGFDNLLKIITRLRM